MLMILAGNRNEAEYYARSQKLKPREWKYIGCPEELAGLEPRAFSMIRIGSFYKRSDIVQINFALSRLFDKAPTLRPEWL